MPRAVLSMLLINVNRVVSLDRLIDELWGEEPPATATTALQVYVSFLRKVLEPDRAPRTPPALLLTRPPGYVLRLSPEAVDAARFEASLAEGRALAAAGRWTSAAETLRRSLALWRGSPYAELAFETFVQPEIARLNTLRAEAVEALGKAELALGDPGRAVVALEELVAQEPLREHAWELLGLALYRSGRQGDALRAMTSARRVLSQELGLDPGPALQRLEADILAQAPSLKWAPPLHQTDLPRPAASVMASAPAERPTRPFVGRTAELAALGAALDDAMRGRGRVVLVAGEPGIGKTRLIEEVVQRATALGAVVAWGRCEEGDGNPAYWPWLQVLRALAAEAQEDAARAALGAAAADIAQVVPELKDLMDDDIEPVPMLEPEAARARLYDGITGFVVRLAAAQPLVVVLDDLHWADLPSLALARLLVSRLGEARLLLVCTYRLVEAEASEPVQATVSAVSRRPQVLRITLPGLLEEDVGELVSVVTGAAPPSGVAGIIWARTEGNPLFVSELVRLLGSEGKIEAGAEMAVQAEIPTAVREVIRRRLARLPSDAVSLLATAAVIGRDFEFDVLAASAGLDDERALELIEAGLLVGLVTESTEVPGHYRFSHSLVRETLYEELSAVRRARLHRRVGEALEQLRRDRPPLVQLAYHFSEGAAVGRDDKAFLYLQRAAAAAEGALAFEQAETHLRRALEVVEAMPPGPKRARRELNMQIRLSLLLGMTKGYASAEVGRAASRAVELSRDAGDPGAALGALFGVAEFSMIAGRLKPARQLVSQLHDLGRRSHDPTILLCAHYGSGELSFLEGRLEEAWSDLTQALAISDSLPEAALAGVMLHRPSVLVRSTAAVVLWLLGDTRSSERMSADALELARGFDGPDLVLSLYVEGVLRAFRQDPQSTMAAAEETLALAEKYGLPLYQACARVLRGWARSALGEREPGLAELEDGLAAFRQTGAKMFSHFFVALLADARIRAGRPEEALEAIDEALAEVDAVGERYWEAELHRVKGEVLARAGADGAGDAIASFERALVVARSQGSRVLESRVAESLVRSARRRSDDPTPSSPGRSFR